MSSTDIIANELNDDTTNNYNGKLILLKGSWGSGKTYRWENKIKPAINRKHKIYISLFGMQNIDEVKQKLYLEGINCKFSTPWCKLIQFIVAIIVPFAIFFYGANFILLEHFSQIRGEIQLFYIIGLIVTLIISIFLFFPVVKSIILYFIDTTFGLNYNTVSLVKLLSPTETVFCFDDFERIAKVSQADTFLGYFNTLARTYGYHILFIAYIAKEDLNRQQNSSQEKTVHITENYTEDRIFKPLLEYQEKLFDKIFEHEQSLAEILKQKDINDVLKSCLFELIDKIQQYSSLGICDESLLYIEKIHGNIRIIFKIIDNMDTVYHYISADTLIDNGIHEKVINFVIGITIAIETGYCSNIENLYEKRLNYGFYYQSSFQKNFDDFLCFYLSDIYGSLYDLIYKGVKNEQFEKEMFPQMKLTLFEKKMLEFNNKYYLEYRLDEIKEIYNKTRDCLKDTEELFSSYTEMFKALGKYCWLLTCMHKNLKNQKETKKILFNNIRKVTTKEQIPLIPFDRISFPIIADDINFEISKKIIITQVYKCLVEMFIKSLPKDKIFEYFLDYNGNTDKYIQDIIYLILMSDNNFVDLQKLSETDYAVFMRIWRKLKEYRISWSEYKNLCQAMNYPLSAYKKLLNKFESIMKNLANRMPENAPEMINYIQFKTDKKNKLQEFMNSIKKS